MTRSRKKTRLEWLESELDRLERENAELRHEQNWLDDVGPLELEDFVDNSEMELPELLQRWPAEGDRD